MNVHRVLTVKKLLSLVSSLNLNSSSSETVKKSVRSFVSIIKDKDENHHVGLFVFFLCVDESHTDGGETEVLGVKQQD